jgi:GT2 family glycosyltransferase
VISIVIVNWNSGSLLERCVRSLRQYAQGCEIVIVDNASTDASLQFAPEMQDDSSIIRMDKNIGFAAGNNRGWTACRGDAILFLNPDIECLPESIRFLEEALIADPAIWAVGGRLVGAENQTQIQYNPRRFPTISSVAAEMMLLDEIWPSHPWSCASSIEETTGAMDVDQPAAACLMVTRSALDVLGGFDEDFFPAWFEDVDLCRRICDQGGRIQFQPRARFLHQGGHSVARIQRRDFLEIFHTNQIRYFHKHHGERAASSVRRWIVCGLALRGALSCIYPLVPGRSRPDSSRTFIHAARNILQLRGGKP